MDTKEVKVFYKKDNSKLLLTIVAGYGTQGECIVQFPAILKEDEFDVGIENIRTFPIVHSDVMVAGKYFPATGKSVILIAYTITEDGKQIHKETIERSLETFERYSHLFMLEKAKEEPKK
jgi:hypothetical protein